MNKSKLSGEFLQEIKRNPVLILAVLLLIYLILRAAWIPVLNDEALTFFYFILPGDFFPLNSPWDPNNHFLNTLFAWLSIQLADNLFMLRLPNLLGYLVFIFFSMKLSLIFKEYYVRILFLSLLWLSHGFIEFFGYARGYGLSMAFFMAGLFYLIQFFSERSSKNYLKCLSMFALALLANLTLLNTWLIVFPALTVLIFRSQRSKALSVLILVAGAGLTLYLVMYLFLLKARGMLYWGGVNGFYPDTIKSLAMMVYNSYLAAPLFLLTGIPATLAGLMRFRKNHTDQSDMAAWIFALLLAINLAGIFMLHFLLEIPYPLDRTGLYLFPLFAGTLCFSLDKWSFQKWITIPLTIILVIMFIRSINLTHATLWPADPIPENFAETIKQQQGKAVISGTRSKELCWDYLNYTHYGTLNPLYTKNFPDPWADYLLCHPRNPRCPEKPVVCETPTGNRLIRNQSDEFISRFGIEQSPDTTLSDEFFNLLQTGKDSIPSSVFRVSYKLRLTPAHSIHDLQLVVTLYDSLKNELFYDRIMLARTGLFRRKGSVTAEYVQQVPATLGEAESMVFYIWNQHADPYSLEEVNITVSTP